MEDITLHQHAPRLKYIQYLYSRPERRQLSAVMYQCYDFEGAPMVIPVCVNPESCKGKEIGEPKTKTTFIHDQKVI